MIAFWLMPAAPQRDFFATLIQELAECHGGPVFAAHVTLLAGELDQERALACLRALDWSPLELEVESIRCSEAFTKTVFVQFHPSAAAAKLSAAIRARIDSNSQYAFDPHLSLIYKTISAERKQDIVDAMVLPFERVRFDCIRVIQGPAHTRTAEDVNAWSTLGEQSPA